MIRQPPPFHQHVQSMDTGSKLEDFVKKNKELQSGNITAYAVVTDHGVMSGNYQFYTECRKKGVKPILGLEVYFKDENCDIVKGTESGSLKYFHLIIHFKDQEAYQAGCRVLSKASENAMTIFGEIKPLFNWLDLEELCKYNITIGTACLLGMVSRHLLVDRPDLAEKYYLKLRDMVGKENFYVELLPHDCSQKFQYGIQITTETETKLYYTGSKFETDAGDKISAEVIFKNQGKHTFIKNRYEKQKKVEVNQKILKVEKLNGFIPEPRGDVQLTANQFCYALAKKYDDKLVISDDAHYALPDDKDVQQIRLGESFRFYGDYSIQTKEQIYKYFTEVMKLSEDEINQMVDNTFEWAKKFDNFELKYDKFLPIPEDDPKKLLFQWIKETGRFKNEPIYRERLKKELDILANNGVLNFLPYFLPIKKIADHCNNKGLLFNTRGSAAGSYLAYLIGISNVDPIKYKLSFERFFNLTRAQVLDIPDIDFDLSDKSFLFDQNNQPGFLTQNFGDKWAQISTKTMIRLKSAMKDVNRYVNKGTVEKEIDKLTAKLPSAPQGISEQEFIFGYGENPGLYSESRDLQDYALQRPEEMKLVLKSLGIPRQSSIHACAVCIADRSIKDIIPTFSIRDSKNITQYTAKEVEACGGVKYDFLNVISLADLQICLQLINQKDKTNLKTGWFMHKGKETFIWDLPHDINVYKMLWNGKTEGLFQINTVTMTPFVKRIKPNSIEDLSTILALVRPGPMDSVDPVTGRSMAEEYMLLRDGKIEPSIPILSKILPETYSVCVFQENLTTIFIEIGDMEPEKAEILRKLMCKKEFTKAVAMKPDFMKGAVKKIGQKDAEDIWNNIEKFARYSFNQGHSTSYAFTTYATAFLKYHYPLEWWAAVISNADDKEINETFFTYIKDIISPPDINLSNETVAIDYETNKLRSKLTMISGLGDKMSSSIEKNRPYKDLDDFAQRSGAGPALARKLLHVGVLDSLLPKGLLLFQKMQILENAMQHAKNLEGDPNQYDKIDKAMQDNAQKFKQLQLKLSEETLTDKQKQTITNAMEKLKQSILMLNDKKKTIRIGKLDSFYANLSPVQDMIEKKKLLPTLPLDIFSLVVRSSDKVYFANKKAYMHIGKYSMEIINGSDLKELTKSQEKEQVCSPGIVLDYKVFPYHGTKSALKVMIDFGGYSVELVQWPGREQDNVIVPKDFDKYKLYIFSLYKSPDKDQFTISDYIEVK
jgi:DNA polymerase III subunit alpha